MEENFYIGYAVDKLDEKRIKDGKIECISKMYGDFKCATLHAVEPEDKIDYTESFNRVGYEIEPYSNTTRNFSFNDAGTIDGLEENIYAVNKFNKEGYNKNYYTHCNMYVFKDPKKTVEIMNNKKQNRIKTLSKFGEKMKNLKGNENLDIVFVNEKKAGKELDNEKLKTSETNNKVRRKDNKPLPELVLLSKKRPKSPSGLPFLLSFSNKSFKRASSGKEILELLSSMILP